MFRLRQLLSGYPELVIVLVATAVGLTVQAPLAWLTSHDGIDTLLVVLVFATAVTIEPAALRRAAASLQPLVVTLVVGATVLPALSWLVSRMVATGSLRHGVMCVGLAPCEIASVATTAMAEGEPAFSVAVLMGSTLATVVVAGPVLALESNTGTVHPAHILVNLVLVVAFPLVAGLVFRAFVPFPEPAERLTRWTATLAVAALVALIAAEVHFSVAYVSLAGALLVFLVASALLGWSIGRRSVRATGTAVLLTTSMRDFAIAASLATTAFGVRAAAPLGLYGVLVVAWGTGAAGRLRQRARG